MDQEPIHRWMEGYIQAWNSNLPDEIGALFAVEARYFTAPYRPPWRGRDGIVSGWLGRKDDQGTFTFRYEIVTVQGNLSVVRGWTHYLDESRRYSNLWLVYLNEDGECTEFIEWWMEED